MTAKTCASPSCTGAIGRIGPYGICRRCLDPNNHARPDAGRMSSAAFEDPDGNPQPLYPTRDEIAPL